MGYIETRDGENKHNDAPGLIVIWDILKHMEYSNSPLFCLINSNMGYIEPLLNRFDILLKNRLIVIWDILNRWRLLNYNWKLCD